MRRYGNIFLIHLQRVLVDRGRVLVWSLTAIVPPLILYAYWRAALSNNTSIGDWNLTTISSYYFLLTVASSILIAHIEVSVSQEDIQQGQLSKYLLRPIAYFTFYLFGEISYRIFQGIFAFVAVFLFMLAFQLKLELSNDPYVLFLAIIISMFGFLLCYTFKMIIGIVALWLTDIGGFYQLIDGIMFLFGGFLLPITLLPPTLAYMSYVLPFSYMIYFPISAFQGAQSVNQMHQIIGVQIIWILGLYVFYTWLFKKGLKKYAAVGQ